MSDPLRSTFRWLKRLLWGLTGIVLLIAAVNFPYDVDRQLTDSEIARNREYYAEATNRTPSLPINRFLRTKLSTCALPKNRPKARASRI